MLTEGIEGKSLDQCCSKNGDIESQSVVPTVLLANRHRKGTILVGVSDLTCTLFLNYNDGFFFYSLDKKEIRPEENHSCGWFFLCAFY